MGIIGIALLVVAAVVTVVVATAIAVN